MSQDIKKLLILFLFSALTVFPGLFAQTPSRFEIFSTKMPEGASWANQDSQKTKFARDGGYSDVKPNYIYVDGPNATELVGLDLRIRENPSGPGEYRYMTFTWVKWGGSQIGIQFIATPDAEGTHGPEYHYTYVAGAATESEKNAFTIETGLSVSEHAPGNWVVNARDVWKDFGDCTITGMRFICPQRRDAGFDEIFLARSLEELGEGPKILPTRVTEAEEVDNGLEHVPEGVTGAGETRGEVDIDWGAQIRAGGIMMYPLYLLAILAVLISVRRFLTSRADRVVPPGLCVAWRAAVYDRDYERALAVCGQYPSTLADSLAYIFRYRAAGKEAVAQVAGDIAARDIKAHLAAIYPISIISSLAPLLGLLGTVVGMIEAFGLVALYGDEGGAAILSDSISKALITTAAGLIIAVPTVSVYYYLKNRITGLTSMLESEIEEVLTRIYLEQGLDSDGEAGVR